jgi:hypothetical protein
MVLFRTPARRGGSGGGFRPSQSVGPAGPPGRPGSDGIGSDGANVRAYGAIGDGVADDTAAVQAAFDSGKSLVYFPPGVYNVGACEADAFAQEIQFCRGASLLLNAAAGPTFSGAKQRIQNLTFTISAASSATYSAATVTGQGSRVDGCTVTLTDDNPNATLFKITGQGVTVKGWSLTANGKAFLNGVHAVAAGGGELKYASIEDVTADVGDDGVATTFGPLIRWHVKYGNINRVFSESGGRGLFPEGVIRIEGHGNALRDANLTLSNGAAYGLYIAGGSGEFLWEGGWIQGVVGSAWRADSEGIYIGHDCYQMTFVNTTVTGFDYGIGFHGSCNIPNFHGCDFSNNQTAGWLIDCKVGDTDFPIRGMTITGGYAEGVAGQPLWMWAKSGYVLGCAITGGFIGYETRAVKVEPTFAGFVGCTISGVNVIGDNAVTSHAIEPGPNDSFLWQENYTQVSSNIATGPYADRVRQQNSSDIELTGLVVGTHGTSTANNRHTKILTDIYTANFGTVNAGATVALTFAYTGAATVTTGCIDATIDGTLGAKAAAGIIFQWYAHSGNTIGGTATNITGSPIASVTGGVRFRVTVFG